MSIYTSAHDAPAVVAQAPQCVTAQDIADAFYQLLQADSQLFVVVVAVLVFITSAPSLLHRLIDLVEARRQSRADS